MRPSSAGATGGAACEHEHGPWPRYGQHRCAYGFDVEVERQLAPTSTGGAQLVPGGGGPRTALALIGDEVPGAGPAVPLTCVSERLVVRPLPREDAPSAAHLLPQGLEDGDVIRTLDGADPTFAALYAMMCRREKLVLEVVSGPAITGGAVSRVGPSEKDSAGGPQTSSRQESQQGTGAARSEIELVTESTRLPSSFGALISRHKQGVSGSRKEGQAIELRHV